jgi:tetratricopeptide (TPR) repeat protein
MPLRWIALASVVLAARLAAADPLLDALDTDDPRALSAAVTAIESAPASPDLADTLFAAARACEDRLQDPGRALVLYDRILRDLPSARVATAAERRAQRLRASVGAHGEHAQKAAELAQLIAASDTLSTDEVTRRASALSSAAWPGAPDAALFLAEVLRRHGDFTAAQARYADVVRTWPGSPQAISALRGGAGNALDAHRWSLAEELAHQLPIVEAADAVLRDDLLAAAAKGRRHGRLYGIAWIVFLLAFAALIASLTEAMLRGGRRLPALRPPFEVIFVVPLGALLVAISHSSNATASPVIIAVTITAAGFAWISGAALDLVRARGRSVRLRAVAHAVCCIGAALAIGYIMIIRRDLLDLLIETMQSGPER